jgi:hypothetical protein
MSTMDWTSIPLVMCRDRGRVRLAAGSELVAALTIVEDLHGALETPGAEEVIDLGEAHDVACDVLCCAVFSR